LIKLGNGHRRQNRRDRFGAGELHRTYCFAALARTQASQSAEREKTTIKKELINRLARRDHYLGHRNLQSTALAEGRFAQFWKD
jgi:hypothetical protein